LTSFCARLLLPAGSWLIRAAVPSLARSAGQGHTPCGFARFGVL
jgi:hypothetical protein